MGIVIRQGSWNTLILFAGIGIGFVNEFLLLRNFLAEEQVGLIKLLIQASALFVQFAALGGVNTVLRFFPFYRDRDREHGGFLFGMLAIGALGLALVSAGLLLFRDAVEARYAAQSPLFADYLYLLFPLIAFGLTFTLVEAYAKSIFRTVAPSFIQEVGLRLAVSACVGAYLLGWLDDRGFYHAFTAVNCATALALVAWLASRGDLRWRPRRAFFEKAALGRLMGFGALTMLSAFSARLYTSIDSLMLGDHVGLGAVAIYLTGTYLASIIMAPARSILRVASPLVANHWKSDDMDAMATLYRQVTTNNLVLTAGTYLLVAAGAPALFTLIPPLYQPAIGVFYILGAARIVDMGTGLNGVILITSRHHYMVFFSNLLTAAVAVATNAWLIPRYGIAGAAWATFGTILLFNGFRLGFVALAFRLWPLGWNTLGISTATVAAFFGVRAFSAWASAAWGPWPASLVAVPLVGALFGGLVWYTGWSPELRAMAQGLLDRLRRSTEP
jgi:O-antigen/teichoic acid export membrane protein